MSQSDWQWLSDYGNLSYRLSEDGTEILADYGDYEEPYMQIPQSRQEFEELDKDDQVFIRQFVGFLPWEVKQSNTFLKRIINIVPRIIIIDFLTTVILGAVYFLIFGIFVPELLLQLLFLGTIAGILAGIFFLIVSILWQWLTKDYNRIKQASAFIGYFAIK